MARSDYEDVAAGQTAQVLGGDGNKGNYLSHLIVIPQTTSPGAVTLLDGSDSLIIFPGGANSVPGLIPFTVFCDMKSRSGPWKITTGANVKVRAVGRFS